MEFDFFRYWVKRDVFHRMFNELSEDIDFEYTIDGTICKVMDTKRGTQNVGKSRGGMTTKILALTDFGNLSTLMPGQAHDLLKTRELLADVCCRNLLAEGLWQASGVIGRKGEAVISNRAPCDMEIGISSQSKNSNV